MPATAFSTAPAEAPALNDSLVEREFLVIALCAAWCNTCTEFRVDFDRLAAARVDGTFVWLDIEDDAELTGDIDVDNFPTIAVFHRGRLLHFGVSLPQGPVVARLLAALTADSATSTAGPEVTALPERLVRAVRAAQRGSSSAASVSPSSAETN